MENNVLLGDLHEPCLKLTNIYGIFDNQDELLSSFVTFHGFPFPSVAIPYPSSREVIKLIFAFLKELDFSDFWVVTFHDESVISLLSKYFHIVDVHREQMMVITREKFFDSVKKMKRTKVVKKAQSLRQKRQIYQK